MLNSSAVLLGVRTVFREVLQKAGTASNPQ
jgi:hypothetical protein